MDSNSVSQCEYARNRHKVIAMWANLWRGLVFVFGTAVVLFLILAILLFIQKTWLPAALTTLGTIASGRAMVWVTARRNAAVEEEVEAYNKENEACGDSKQADEVRSDLKLTRIVTRKDAVK